MTKVKCKYGTVLWMAIIGGILSGVAAIFLALNWFEQTELTERLQSRISSVASIAAPYAASAITRNDDLALIDLMKALAVHPGMQEAMIIDSNGQVVAHTRPDKIGKLDKEALNIFSGHNLAPVRIYSENKETWAFPLNNFGAPKNILKLSVLPTLELAHKERFRLKLTVTAIMVIVISGIIAYQFTSRQDAKINEWVNILRQVVSGNAAPAKPGTIETHGWNELGRLFNTLNNKLTTGDFGSLLEKFQADELVVIFNGIGDCIVTPVIFLDAAGKIVFLNTPGKELMLNSRTNMTGFHFSEVCRNAELLEAIAWNSPKLNEPVTEEIKSVGKKVKINVMADRNGKRLGTVIIGV